MTAEGRGQLQDEIADFVTELDACVVRRPTHTVDHEGWSLRSSQVWKWGGGPMSVNDSVQMRMIADRGRQRRSRVCAGGRRWVKADKRGER